MTEPGGSTSASRPLRVVLVEDEDLFRNLLRGSLEAEAESGLRVVGSFGDSDSALVAVPALRPDVAVLDIQLGGSMDGIRLGLELRRTLPQLGIVILSNHSDPRFLAPLPEHAIDGWSYLLKSSIYERTVLTRAIQGCAAGQVVVDAWVVQRQRPRPGSALASLQPRQREILGLVAQGWTNAAIAEHLVITEKTVENALSGAYMNLGLNRRDGARHLRVQAVLAFLRDGVWSDANEPLQSTARSGVHPAANPPSVRSKGPTSETRHSVLIVDDQPAFLDAARQMLGANPHLTVLATATSGRDALLLIPKLAPEIVLLDIQMAGMNGFETAEAIHALAPQVRIVLISSDDHVGYAHMARQLHSEFIAKGRLSAENVLALAGYP